MILFGKCNFRCKFCFENGDLAARSGIIPGAKQIPYHTILNFIKGECTKKNWIKITGGEPSLFPEIALELIDKIHSYGSRACVDTNGSFSEIVKKISEKVDILGLDIKGNYNNISYLTGVPRRRSYYPVIETIKNSNSYNCLIEVKTVLFAETTFSDLSEIHSLIPQNAYWEWKQYRPHSGIFRAPKKYPFQPMQNKQVYRLARQMVDKYPELRRRLIVVCGSGRIVNNYYMFSDDLHDETLSHENYRVYGNKNLAKVGIL